MSEQPAVVIQSDEAAYKILTRLNSELVAAIDKAIAECDDNEEIEIMEGLISGAARHLASEEINKSVE